MFGNPWMLLGLWILPLVVAVLRYAHWRRRVAARHFAGIVMSGRLAPPASIFLPLVKGALILIGIALLVFAAAEPRTQGAFEDVAQRSADIVILLDVSKSMTAEDVGQSRLQRAKSDIRDLLSRLVRDRVGLVVFAGKPAVKAPLTTDHGFFLSVLDEIDTDSAPRGGSHIGDGIRKCLEILPPEADRDQVIVLITDGEDHESLPLEAAHQARERGVKIIAVGLGDTKDGARVPVWNESGERRFMKHQGQEVWSVLDEQLLKEIAAATEGAYVGAGTKAYDLGQVYENHLAGLSRSEHRSERRRRYEEQFQWFLAAGILLLVIELAVPAYPRPIRPVTQEA
jgi:Ca-activated chloride channel family protein